MKAKKLPSGNYRVKTLDYVDADGKRHYKSFTAPTKREAEQRAALYSTENLHGKSVTFRRAMEDYIASKDNVLSPTTILSYRSIQKQTGPLDPMDIQKMTQTDIQRFINEFASNHTPKTVRNVHGLIVAVIHSVRPEMVISTALPQKKIYDMHIPEDEDVKKLIAAAEGPIKKAILLAALGPMRRGEVCGLRYEDIDYKTCTIHVHASMCKGTDGKWMYKPVPKTTASDRYITYPKKVIKQLGQGEGYIIGLNPDQIYKRFKNICSSCGLPSFRFHDLRHYSASIQHALGVPDAYIMQRGGWSSDNVLKAVYRHTLETEAKKHSDKVNSHFDDLL